MQPKANASAFSTRNRTFADVELGKGVAVSEIHAIPTELSEEAQLKLQVLQTLIEPCDRTTYGEKLREAAES